MKRQTGASRNASSQASPIRVAAAGDDQRLPVVPRIGEVARQSGVHEVAARRHFAGEAAQVPGVQRRTWKSRSSPGASGLSTDPARISNDAVRSPRMKSRL